MMSSFKFLMIFGFLFAISLTSCKKDDKEGDNCSSTLQASADNLGDLTSDAFVAYTNDSSLSNCLAYEDALNNYVRFISYNLPCLNSEGITNPPYSSWVDLRDMGNDELDKLSC